jgi:hypothetical protein
MDQRALQRRAHFCRETARYEGQYGEQAPVSDPTSAGGGTDFGWSDAAITDFR